MSKKFNMVVEMVYGYSTSKVHYEKEKNVEDDGLQDEVRLNKRTVRKTYRRGNSRGNSDEGPKV